MIELLFQDFEESKMEIFFSSTGFFLAICYTMFILAGKRNSCPSNGNETSETHHSVVYAIKQIQIKMLPVFFIVYMPVYAVVLIKLSNPLTDFIGGFMLLLSLQLIVRRFESTLTPKRKLELTSRG